MIYCKYIKRILDLVIASIALFFLFPVFPFIALMIKMDSSGPVIFVQNRLGRMGKIFKIYKFRTMTNRTNREENREVMDNDPEVTRIGYWLRRYKIDELPQLVNVLKGDMSLVGPRPALVNQLKDYDSRVLKRLHVRPGLTGWAQVNGNRYLPWAKRWEFDVWYVEHCSFWLDLKIIFLTFKILLYGEKYIVRG